LEHQLKSILSEILQHGRGHKYLIDHGFKSHPEHPLVLVLPSQKDKQNTLSPGYSLAGTKGFVSWDLLHPFAELTPLLNFRTYVSMTPDLGGIMSPNEVD